LRLYEKETYSKKNVYYKGHGLHSDTNSVEMRLYCFNLHNKQHVMKTVISMDIGLTVFAQSYLVVGNNLI
jgi:hypothetical protein